MAFEQLDGLLAQLDEIIANSNNIVFFGGAGVSTESGIPDFRSADGQFSARQIYGHAPEYLVSHEVFVNQPELFFRYYRDSLVHRFARPNPAHLALAKLEREGKLLAIITQNIDGLHQMAGSKVVHELHGSIHRNNCQNCGRSYNLEYILESSENSGLPVCEFCGGIVKPSVVLYGEPLDASVMRAASAAVSRADTMIVGGTSLVVYPAAGFVDQFTQNKMAHKRLVILNKGETDKDMAADLIIRASIGDVLGRYISEGK
jgi:NAD-dependent deacetylase